MIELLGVAARAGRRELLAPLSLRFPPGRVTAILGPNGAGKSTLLGLMAGLRAPHGGQVLLNGQTLGAQSATQLALQRAFMPQDASSAFDFTVREIVQLGRYPHRLRPASNEEGLIDDALRATGVLELQHRVLNTLSGGEKARAQLARVLCQVWETSPDERPRWLLLDEPTAALDLSHQHQVLRLVQAWAHGRGVGVVAVLHDLNLALRYADDVLLLKQGRVEAWGPAATVLSPEAVAGIWNVPCEAARAADGVPQFLIGA